MGVFEFRIGHKKPTSGETAKERLKVVLVHDRLKINPELLEQIKDELLIVLSRRLEVDAEHMKVNLERDNGADTLQTYVPVKRQKVTFEWDPPSHTPSNNVLRGKVHIEESGE